MLNLNQEDLQAISSIVEGFIVPIHQELGVMRNDIDSLKKDVAGLKKDVASLKVDVSVLKEDVAKLQEDMSDVKSRLTTLECTVKKNYILLEDFFVSQKEFNTESRKFMDHQKILNALFHDRITQNTLDIRALEKKIS
ncbi:hypothetical protein NXH76_01680 [Blautia schinkii]|nr:hypothetical protein [Blautia schinkii]